MQVATLKQKSEKQRQILEANLKNAEAEVDELDELINNCYGILKQHPKVLAENTSLQVLFSAIAKQSQNQ